MSMPPEPSIPLSVIAGIGQSLEKLANAAQSAAIATLTAAIVTARGKPTSINEVLEIAQNINFAMYPAPNHGLYKEWATKKEAKLAKIYD